MNTFAIAKYIGREVTIRMKSGEQYHSVIILSVGEDAQFADKRQRAVKVVDVGSTIRLLPEDDIAAVNVDVRQTW